MNRNNVKNLYAIGHARWYDLFKKIWNKLVATQAEKDLTAFLKGNLDETKTVLELGCGTALNLEKIIALKLKFKKYLGLDFSPDMLSIAKKKFSNAANIEFQGKDITHLHDIHSKFDVIICTWVLSHLQSPSQMVNQAQKLLSPHGKCFFIFFSEPKGLIKIGLDPLARYFFKCKPVPNQEVDKFMNIRTKHQFAGGITTSLIIQPT